MDFKVKKLAKSEVELTVTVSKEEMDKFEKKACDVLSQDVKVKGFRPGHVPPHILEQHIEKKYITAHAQELAIQGTYVEAVLKEKLQVASRPKIDIQKEKEGELFTYTATVATVPEVEVKDYKSIKIKKKEVKIGGKEVNEVIENMQKESKSFKDVDRAGKNGDRVEASFEGFDDDGKTVEGTKSENHPIVLGDKTMIPGFEEALVGLKKGEKKDFDIIFPKDYFKKEYQSKKVKFKIEMTAVQEPVEAKLDEEFVKKVTGKEMKVEEFKKEVKDMLASRDEQKVKQESENEYVDALVKKMKVELPDSLIDEETEMIIHDIKHDVEGKGQKFDDILKAQKTTIDELKKKYRPEAEKRVKGRLALQYVIKEERIEIKDEDIKAEVDKIKAHYPAEQHDKIVQDFEKGELGQQVRSRLTLRKLFEKVLG